VGFVLWIIREQDPLKQGLKHKGKDNMTETITDSRARSIKTRIETQRSSRKHPKRFLIREQDPLKQGLKLTVTTYDGASLDIREQDPLKQGLKLLPFFLLPEPLSTFASKIH